MRKTKVTFNNEQLNYSSELMRALAHPLRLRILKFIDGHGAINVNKIYNALNIEQSITSQHLKVMKIAGIVTADREGKYVRYHINYDVVQKAVKAVNNFLKK